MNMLAVHRELFLWSRTAYLNLDIFKKICARKKSWIWIEKQWWWISEPMISSEKAKEHAQSILKVEWNIKACFRYVICMTFNYKELCFSSEMYHRKDFIARYVICLSFMNKNFICYISVTITLLYNLSRKKWKEIRLIHLLYIFQFTL